MGWVEPWEVAGRDASSMASGVRSHAISARPSSCTMSGLPRRLCALILSILQCVELLGHASARRSRCNQRVAGSRTHLLQLLSTLGPLRHDKRAPLGCCMASMAYRSRKKYTPAGNRRIEGLPSTEQLTRQESHIRANDQARPRLVTGLVAFRADRAGTEAAGPSSPPPGSQHAWMAFQGADLCMGCAEGSERPKWLLHHLGGAPSSALM